MWAVQYMQTPPPNNKMDSESTSESTEVLDQFLSEWKTELKAKRAQPDVNTGADEGARDEVKEEPARKHYCPMPASCDDTVELNRGNLSLSSNESSTSSAVIGGPSLFVLPAGGTLPISSSTTSNSITGVQSQMHSSSSTIKKKSHSSLIDKLITDLDEMNTVPFFEVQLPRELALLIFNYLSVVDLCHCAQVSHSWAALAEDNLLWIALCRRMGYSTELVKDQAIHWKTVVKELILHRKQVQQNWMERVCTVTVHKPSSSIGSLCTATYHNREVLACYSTGVCHLWSLSTKESVLAPPTVATPTCSALCNSMGCHCDASGNCTLFSLEDSKVNYTYKINDRIHSLDMATNSSHYAVGFASGGNDSFSSLTLLLNKDSSLSDWYKSTVQLPSSAQFNNFHINKVSLVLSDKENSPFLLLYSTHSHLVLQSPLESFINATHFLGEDSPCFVNCFTHSHQSSTVACGSIHYGYHEVRLFDIISGVNKESYRGHSGRICSLSFDRVQNNRLISGGEDKRLNLYDSSSNYPVTSLFGMSSPVVCLQLEDWKVVSGSRDGTVAVWDLRIGQELWRGHDRHSVSLCEVDNEYLIVAHIPSVQPPSTNGSPQHSRQCGTVRMYDFSADLSDYAKKLPSICSSLYDEPSASFYNLNLLYPYDIIQ